MKLSDEIAKLEDAYEEVCTELKIAESKIDDYEVEVARLRKIIDEFDKLEDFINEREPELITAFDVLNRMEG